MNTAGRFTVCFVSPAGFSLEALLYFRYRRNLKCLEENLEEKLSLVPKLIIPDRRVVPPTTSPELVMFCRRVYDFRSKRLVEDKKKK